MPGQPMPDALREQGRGVIGALLFGAPFLLTMETWWIGRTLPAGYVLAYAAAGLALILLLIHVVGFREEEDQRRTPLRHALVDFSELLLQALAASIVVLFLFGVVEWGTPPQEVVRVVLLQVVPLGLGAAIANRLLRGVEEDPDARGPRFARTVSLFGLGALFFTFPIAPTEEVELLASSAGWARMPFIMAASLVVTYLSLYELEFRGHAGRVAGLDHAWLRWGEACLAYVVALVVSLLVLLAFGHFADGAWLDWTQDVVVLAFPAALGGSAARVVL